MMLLSDGEHAKQTINNYIVALQHNVITSLIDMARFFF